MIKIARGAGITPFVRRLRPAPTREPAFKVRRRVGGAILKMQAVGLRGRPADGEYMNGVGAPQIGEVLRSVDRDVRSSESASGFTRSFSKVMVLSKVVRVGLAEVRLAAIH